MNRLKRAWQSVRGEVSIYRRVLHDPRTPWLPKLILGLAAAYLVSPVDIIPDCIPVIGHLDDLLIVPGLVWLALRLIPKDIVDHARRDAAGDPASEQDGHHPNVGTRDSRS